MLISENIAKLKKNIATAVKKANKKPASIQIVAVTKTVEIDRIKDAIDHGITIIGENRVQEAKRKYAVIGDQAIWHMVGHLQTNKVRDALQVFSLIHSLDSMKLAQEIEKRAVSKTACLIEINTSQETTKYGIQPDEAVDFFRKLEKYKKIEVKGLMTIGPGWAIQNKEASRPCFRLLASLKDKIEKECECSLPILSMGMTSDYDIAIEEGANMIRVGTALFGPRE